MQTINTKTYDKYKDSGIEWIGKIPEHWEVCRLKNYAKIQNGQDFKSVEDDNGFIPVIGSGGEFARANECLYHGESILLGRKGTIDKPLYVNCAFWTVDTMYYTQLENITFGKYFYYLCKTINFDFYQYGSAVPSMTQRDLNSVQFPLPRKDEQQQIADYLDKKCGEIDRVVEIQKDIIEKLKEYKQSVITEAVTKGLDKSAPLKDSGIEWIGKIPQHWEVCKIKHQFYLSLDVNNNENATLLSLFTHIGVRPRTEMEDKGNKAQTVMGYSLVKKGDIIVNKLLAWMGAIGLSNYDGATSPDYDIYRLRNTEKNNPLFYHYLYRSSNFKDECYKYGRGIMLMRLRTYPEEFLNIFIPKILKEEQDKIVNYLNVKCSEIDSAISDKEQLIEKLTEYKKSLIYECVTGKRRVVV